MKFDLTSCFDHVPSAAKTNIDWKTITKNSTPREAEAKTDQNTRTHILKLAHKLGCNKKVFFF